MTAIVYICTRFVYYLVVALQFCMFIRAVMSWIMPDSDGPVTQVIYAVTEPLMFPVRCLVEKIPALRDLPIDISFMITYLLLILIQYLL